MSLDLWCRDDVARILDALCSASNRYPEPYGAAYRDALRDVALAFGLIPSVQVERVQLFSGVPCSEFGR